MSSNPTMEKLADQIIDWARKEGASEVAVDLAKSRFIELERRDGQLEKIREASSAGLNLALYVDGRYSSHSTNDMRPEALEAFVKRAVPMTRLLSVDPFQGLAEPVLYEGRSDVDLQILDSKHSDVTPEARQAIATQVEEGARSVKADIISVTSGYYDSFNENLKVHSNGFSGYEESSDFWCGADVSVNDPSGKKPSGWDWVGSRTFDALPSPFASGVESTKRATSRIGQTQLPSGTMTVVLENRIAGGLLRHLLRAAQGAALQQKQSFLLDKLDQKLGSEVFTLIDDPLKVKGFASKHFDRDGISAKARNLIEAGVLRSFLIDVYYGRKLGVTPTGGGTSNLVVPPGKRSFDELLADIPSGVFVTSLLGGNSDTTRGDFSHGIAGFAIENGTLGAPIGEMNIAGNHTTFWNQLVEVGNDPYLYTSTLTPTLVFEGVSVSGA